MMAGDANQGPPGRPLDERDEGFAAVLHGRKQCPYPDERRRQLWLQGYEAGRAMLARDELEWGLAILFPGMEV